MIASKPHRLAKVFIAIVLASTLVGSLCAQSPPTPAASGLLKPPELPTRLPWYTPPSPVLNLPAAPRDAALPPAPATAVAPAPAQPERPPSSTQPSPETASSEPAVSGSLRTFENPHLTSTAQAGAAPQVVPQPVIVQSQIATENSAALPNPGGVPVDPAAQPSGAVNLALPIKPLTEPYWVSTLQSLSTSGQADLQPLVFDQAIWDALSFSPYVKGVMTVPLVSQAKISEATGIFDPLPFVDSIFDNSSDPAGTTLVTGGPLRLNETRYDNGVGIKSKNVRGGTAELSQNVLMRNNNSVFLAPKNQADSKLVLRLNQPLMKGAGQAYTTSSIRIAEFNAGVSQQEATRKLQLHAQSIAQAYWNLYSARVIEMQAERGKLRLTFLRDELSKRAEVDGLKSQMLRAEAAIARQQANIARAKAETASAQAALRALVNSPQLAGGPTAVVPATPPIDQPFVIDRTQELQTALAFHPELLATRDRIKAATTRLNVAENELRPTLNLVMEGYLHSLSGDYAIADSMVNQFTGRPSYGGGLNYERPYRNVVAKAILRERRLELRQLLLDLDNTMLNITAEVDQAIAAITATYTELEASEKATLAFDAEVRYLEGRWQNAFVESMSPSLLLDELLNAENQLIQAESAWARAQAEHMIAFVNLHVATGMLLNAVPLPPQSE